VAIPSSKKVPTANRFWKVDGMQRTMQLAGAGMPMDHQARGIELPAMVARGLRPR